MGKAKYKKRYWIILAISVVFLILCSYLNALSTRFSSSLETGSVLNDIGFRLIAFNPIYPDIADMLLAIANIGFIIYIIYKKSCDEVPFYITCIALFELFRAAILPLTPLPTPIESHNFGIFGSLLVIGGTFPSGHAGQVFLLFFMISWNDLKSKYAMLAAAILESLVMIAGRGHYTIDVIASFFIVFFIYTIMSKYKKNIFAYDKML